MIIYHRFVEKRQWFLNILSNRLFAAELLADSNQTRQKYLLSPAFGNYIIGLVCVGLDLVYPRSSWNIFHM